MSFKLIPRVEENLTIPELGIQRRPSEPSGIQLDNRIWLNTTTRELKAESPNGVVTREGRGEDASPIGSTILATTDVIRLDDSSLWKVPVSGTFKPRFFKRDIFNLYGSNTRGVAATVLSDGSIIASYYQLAGTARTLRKYDPSGREDLQFTANVGSWVSNGVLFLTYDSSSDRIYVYVNNGTISITGNTGVTAVTNPVQQIDTDGKLTAFSTTLGAVNGTVNHVEVDGGGNVVLCGNFTTVNAVTRNRVLRSDSTGVVDTAFSATIGTGANGVVHSIKKTLDGGYIVAGDFTNFGSAAGTARVRAAKLNEDGTVDVDFSSNLGPSGFGSAVLDVIQLPDSSYVFGGLFTAVQGTSGRNRLAKLNNDGTFNGVFSANLGSYVSNGIQDIRFVNNRIYATTTDQVTVPIFTVQTNGSPVTNVFRFTGTTFLIKNYVHNNTLFLCGSYSTYDSDAANAYVIPFDPETGDAIFTQTNYAQRGTNYVLFENDTLTSATVQFPAHFISDVGLSVVVPSKDALLVRALTISGKLVLERVALFEATPFPNGGDGALVINNGQTVNIAAGQIYDYSSINILPGGTLNIDATLTPELTQIYCTGTFNLQGSIIGRRIGNGGTFTSTTAAGETVAFTIDQRLGGDGQPGNGSGGSGLNGFGGGGGGGNSDDWGGPGGSGGAPGTTTNPWWPSGNQFYGLGGTGNHTLGNGETNFSVGYPWGGWGGRGGGSGGGGGGSGGLGRSPRQGGLGGAGGGYKGRHGIGIYLYLLSTVTGDGQVLLNGTNGFTGGNAIFTGDASRGTGGAGGGGAGGSGGTIIVREVGNAFTNQSATTPTPGRIYVNLTGGNGGAGGVRTYYGGGAAGTGQNGTAGSYISGSVL